MQPSEVNEHVVNAYQLGFQAARNRNISRLHFIRGCIFGAAVMFASHQVIIKFFS